jgi:hypothetical protein
MSFPFRAATQFTAYETTSVQVRLADSTLQQVRRKSTIWSLIDWQRRFQRRVPASSMAQERNP